MTMSPPESSTVRFRTLAAVPRGGSVSNEPSVPALTIRKCLRSALVSNLSGAPQASAPGIDEMYAGEIFFAISFGPPAG